MQKPRQLIYQVSSQNRKNNRKIDILWYNPLFSKNVSTNIGSTFLELLDAEFTEEHVLRKIFNRNTVKIRFQLHHAVHNMMKNH